MTRLTALWRRTELPIAAWGLLALAAIAVGVAGYLHGRLFWDGYAQVRVVGPLFWLNAVGSGVVIALLLLGRALMFAAGAVMISLGAIVSILISHSTSFFGFAEHRYDGRATTIVVAECVAAGLVLVAMGFARLQLARSPGGPEAAR